MKVRLFEEYSDGISMISYEEFIYILHTNDDNRRKEESFSNSEVDMIESIFGFIEYIRVDQGDDNIHIRGDGIDINIFKYEDEWYLLSATLGSDNVINKASNKRYLYYMCDQFYSVINLIQDLIKK